jgi:3-hydroxybutyryl-CoA dehydrogenase
MKIKKNIGIIGAGAMGSGIAQVASAAGCDVIIYDIDSGSLSKALQKLQKILNRQVEKGRMTDEEVIGLMGRIHPTNDLNSFVECDLIIEAIVENMDVKKQVFNNLEKIVKEDCILASNTSSLSITELGSSCITKDRFIGIHFFNPPVLMKLVEIIPSVHTSDSVFEVCRHNIEAWGKIAVKAADSPGFIVNKVARPFYSEALKIYEEGIADAATIDWAMTKLGGFRMGPFSLMDYIGHDVNYKVTTSVWESFYYDDRYKPSFSQKQLVQAGHLGRKTGKGFYDYADGSPVEEPNTDQVQGEYILNRILSMLINEAADTVSRGICNEEDVELAMKYGVNYPKGLLEWGEEIGIGHVVSLLDRLYDRYHESRYRVSPYLRDRVSVL